MLEQVCEQIHNYFVKSPNPGTYTVTGSTISPAVPLLDGQRFWIVGSVLNDGVYTYHADGLKDDDDENDVTLADETFSGSVCGLAVPREVLDLVSEIGDWVDTYGDAMKSPYMSESVIGVYSYTKKSGSGRYGSGSIDWTDEFKSRLDRWRKVSL